jgi:hypothetical protein
MIFVRHKRNWSNAGVLEMGPLRALQIDTAPPQVYGLLGRLLIPHPQRLLEVHWPEGTARFLVPSAKILSRKILEVNKRLLA